MLASEKGYLFGGMDFVDRSQIQPSENYPYAYYPSKKHGKKELIRPGYNYGLDYSDKSGQIDDSDRYYYQGYGPQKSKLKSQYAADPHAPINTYMTENVESVNPVRLIGDTLSNQKINKEKPLTEDEKHSFSTSFVPPPGFKRDHVTVHQAPKPSEPICYSLSAKKRPQSAEPTRQNQIQYHVRSKTPDASNNDRWNHDGRKEVNLKTLLTDEALRIVKKPEHLPEWANRGQLRHISWSNRPKVLVCPFFIHQNRKLMIFNFRLINLNQTGQEPPPTDEQQQNLQQDTNTKNHGLTGSTSQMLDIMLGKMLLIVMVLQAKTEITPNLIHMVGMFNITMSINHNTNKTIINMRQITPTRQIMPVKPDNIQSVQLTTQIIRCLKRAQKQLIHINKVNHL